MDCSRLSTSWTVTASARTRGGQGRVLREPGELAAVACKHQNTLGSDSAEKTPPEFSQTQDCWLHFTTWSCTARAPPDKSQLWPCHANTGYWRLMARKEWRPDAALSVLKLATIQILGAGAGNIGVLISDATEQFTEVPCTQQCWIE